MIILSKKTYLIIGIFCFIWMWGAVVYYSIYNSGNKWVHKNLEVAQTGSLLDENQSDPTGGPQASDAVTADIQKLVIIRQEAVQKHSLILFERNKNFQKNEKQLQIAFLESQDIKKKAIQDALVSKNWVNLASDTQKNTLPSGAGQQNIDIPSLQKELRDVTLQFQRDKQKRLQEHQVFIQNHQIEHKNIMNSYLLQIKEVQKTWFTLSWSSPWK